jgi:hypothetical protein
VQAGKQVRDKAFRQAGRARKTGSLSSMHSRPAGVGEPACRQGRHVWKAGRQGR